MWGKHLILDCAGCSNIDSSEVIREFVTELVKAIDMKAVGEPVIQYLCPEPRLAGLSLMQLIETSSITGHFCDESGEAYLDIFSCKDFDPKIAVEVVKEFFEPEAYSMVFLGRNAPY